MLRGGTARQVGLTASTALLYRCQHGGRCVASTPDAPGDDPFQQLLATLKHVDTKGKKKSKHGDMRQPPVAPGNRATASSGNSQQAPVVTRKFENRSVPPPVSTSAPETAAGTADASVSKHKGDTTSSNDANAAALNKEAKVASTSDRIKKLLDEENDRLRFGPRAVSPTASPPAASGNASMQAKPAVASTTLDTPLVAGAAAVLPLTTSEMIQEGAPQHFVRESEAIERPLLTAHGCVAMGDVVGRVTSPPKLLDDDNGNGVYAELMLEYIIPFVSSPITVVVEARAYGLELSNYASQVVREDDMVHVSGHLLPLAAGGISVVALPQGGNLSIVLQAPTK